MTDITQAEHEAALATASTEATREGASAERTRISAIINSEAGQARPTAALAAAMDTDMSAEQATAFLAKLPEEPKPSAAAPATPAGAGAPKGMFKAAMDGSPNPDLGEEGGESALSEEDIALAQSRPHAPRKVA